MLVIVVSYVVVVVNVVVDVAVDVAGLDLVVHVGTKDMFWIGRDTKVRGDYTKVRRDYNKCF